MISSIISTSVLAPVMLPGFNLINNSINYTKKVKQIATVHGIPPKFLLSIWQEETRQAVWARRGTSGEYGPFQIMPNTAKYYKCKGRWKTNFTHNALCSAEIISQFNCRNYLRKAAKYNTGRCNRVNQYARNVYKRMRK